MIENVPGIYNTPSIYKAGGGGGGDIPVPDGYKELLYIRPDCDENSVRNNGAAYCNLGPSRNDLKWVIEIVDFTVMKQWYINNNIGTVETQCLGTSNGKIRYLMFRMDSGNFQARYWCEGYDGANWENIPATISKVEIDKVNAHIDSYLLQNGGGSPSIGNATSTLPWGGGTSIPPLKIGTIKMYDTQDNLVHDWRPVEKLNGGDNRFGFYDVTNNVFKASDRAGRYMIPGPEVV